MIEKFYQWCDECYLGNRKMTYIQMFLYGIILAIIGRMIYIALSYFYEVNNELFMLGFSIVFAFYFTNRFFYLREEAKKSQMDCPSI